MHTYQYTYTHIKHTHKHTVHASTNTRPNESHPYLYPPLVQLLVEDLEVSIRPGMCPARQVPQTRLFFCAVLLGPGLKE